MFANVFEELMTRRDLHETAEYAAADIQRIYDGCLQQGLSFGDAIAETELLCNISHLVISATGQAAAYRSY